MVPVVILAYLISFTFDTSAQLSHLLLDLVLSRPNSRKMEVQLFNIKSLIVVFSLMDHSQSEADFIGLRMATTSYCKEP